MNGNAAMAEFPLNKPLVPSDTGQAGQLFRQKNWVKMQYWSWVFASLY
jgi:hypothetical protein